MIVRLCIVGALLLALITGTLADRPKERPPIHAGGYRVLMGDFHVHSGLGSGGSLTPWGLVTEADRQGLDVVALTGHNETWDARAARAFSHIASVPIVLVGEEITSRTQDLIAIGITETISPALSLPQQIADIHRQGGIAIAPHPLAKFHDAYRAAGVMAMLDGTEVCHPIIYGLAGSAAELASFAASTPATPIGSSDFHASGRVGACRTFVFVNDATERGVLDAIRAHRTVVFGQNGRAFGDPALVTLAEDAGLRDIAAHYERQTGSWLDWISRLSAAAGMLGIAWTTRSRASRPESGFP